MFVFLMLMVAISAGALQMNNWRWRASASVLTLLFALVGGFIAYFEWALRDLDELFAIPVELMTGENYAEPSTVSPIVDMFTLVVWLALPILTFVHGRASLRLRSSEQNPVVEPADNVREFPDYSL